VDEESLREEMFRTGRLSPSRHLNILERPAPTGGTPLTPLPEQQRAE